MSKLLRIVPISLAAFALAGCPALLGIDHDYAFGPSGGADGDAASGTDGTLGGEASGGDSSSTGFRDGSSGFSDGSEGDDRGGSGNDGPMFSDAPSPDAAPLGDPTTCAQAALGGSYFGCDFWPTVTPNIAWSIFDFGVVVANASSQAAQITLTGPNATHQTASVPPGSTTALYLPWVAALKGPDADNCGQVTPMTASVFAATSAYHLVSSVPVTVYQFSAMEYAGTGGPAGKDWSACPGSQLCALAGAAVGCYSFSNDASLLLPSSAMTGNYRVTGHGGWGAASMPASTTITATQDGTTVNVKVSSSGNVAPGAGVTENPSGIVALTMNAGDVVELVGSGTDASDLSGSLIQATHPVQVITGMACLDVPDTASSCDHVEESNFPAETLGTDYVVPQPIGPTGAAVGQDVRIYGNTNGTTLTYSSQPAGCPSTINAGQVVDCGVVAQDFEVKGTSAFAVSVFTQGASIVDPGAAAPNQSGDPDQSHVAAVEQFRTSYVFPAPVNYTQNFLVVVEPTGAVVTLDGAAITQSPTPVASTGYGVLRVPLASGPTDAHSLTSTLPVSLQVMGYGSYTSYQYPGGLGLRQISAPPQ